MMRLQANAVFAGVDDEIDVRMVVLAEGGDGSGHSISVQRLLEFDSQDAELGQDTYSITIDGGPTVYGGLVSVSVEQNMLHLRLAEAAAEKLGVDTELAVTMNVDPGTARRVREELPALVGDDDAVSLELG